MAPAMPEEGEDFDALLDDFERIIVPGITHWNHPRFFAYFSITGSEPAVLAELLAAALNVNGMLWRMSPAATEVEEVALKWLRDALGLPPSFFGVVYDTASVSGLHALAAARESLSLDVRNLGTPAAVSRACASTAPTRPTRTSKRTRSCSEWAAKTWSRSRPTARSGWIRRRSTARSPRTALRAFYR